MENNTKVENNTKNFCSECGTQVVEKAEICPNCGVRVKKANQKNRIAAALLAIFLGGLGIHKFYLGKKGAGILYLVFFWTVIPGIIGFFEGIFYLLKSDEEFYEKYSD